MHSITPKNNTTNETLSTPLSDAERTEWEGARQGIAERKQAFFELAELLKKVRDRHLYREDYGTFDAFLASEVGIHRSYAYRAIEAHETRSNLSPIGDIIPAAKAISNESQLRELRNVPADMLGKVVALAEEIANGREITAANLAEAREQILASELRMHEDFVDSEIQCVLESHKAWRSIAALCDAGRVIDGESDIKMNFSASRFDACLAFGRSDDPVAFFAMNAAAMIGRN